MASLERSDCKSKEIKLLILQCLLNGFSSKRTGALLVLQMLKISGRTSLTALLKAAIPLQIPTLPSSQYFPSFLASMAKLFVNYLIIPPPGLKAPADAVL